MGSLRRVLASNVAALGFLLSASAGAVAGNVAVLTDQQLDRVTAGGKAIVAAATDAQPRGRSPSHRPQLKPSKSDPPPNQTANQTPNQTANQTPNQTANTITTNACAGCYLLIEFPALNVGAIMLNPSVHLGP